jgi:1-acyl-sn-glycerol-3-phosphate acyltransferase
MPFRPNRHRIHRFDWLYWVLKPWVTFSFRQYYSRITVVDAHKIPDNLPVIFAPNHQNALMDALAVLYATHGQPVFLARADIFNNPTQARLLHFLKIMPVFRIRDGAENLSKNDETFQACLSVLHDRHALCLMPEGNHGDKQRLRPLVKGIFRIAMLTQEELGESVPVQMVPVGLDYHHYQNFRRPLLVQFGDPIDVSGFLPLYRENKPKAFNAMRDILAEKLSQLMIDIRNDTFYDVIHELRFIYTPHFVEKDHYSAFRFDKHFTTQLDQFAQEQPEKLEPLAAKVRELKEGTEKLNLRYWLFRKKAFQSFPFLPSLLLLVLGFPLFLYGLIHNILPYWFPVRFIRIRKVKDPQFHSSFKFVLAFLLFPLVYLLFFLASLLVLPHFWMSLLYLLSLPVTGFLAFNYFILLKKVRGFLRFRRMKKRKDPYLMRLIQLHDDIIQMVQQLVTSPI